MTLIECPVCAARNRPESRYCMRCGKPLPRPDCAAAAHARAWVEHERQGPFFGAYPEALDFTPASLARLDTLITEMWGPDGDAPGAQDWQPSASKMPVVINFGAYLGEVLVRALPARWEMHPEHPDVVIAARVIDAQGRRINTFAQAGARFRDGATVGMASLYTALTGRTLPAWTRPELPPAGTPGPVRSKPTPTIVDTATLLSEAHRHADLGHWGNVILACRRILAIQPGHPQARRLSVLALAQSGSAEEALHQLDDLRRQQPEDVELIDWRALVLVQLNRLDDALGTLDMALHRKPGELSLMRRRGYVLLKKERYARAAADFERVLASNPTDAQSLLGLAHALEQQGQISAACERLRAVLNVPAEQCDPTIADAARAKLAVLQPK